ncbi:site-specific DNA-methyltransferase [Brachyspira innocens]|uniref:DNA-methyltransferase n=1 Tax=Brachyspira innocens TaxID=13264 RepID=UPI0026EB40D7|nr:site-specific DNA-methyltransferase [Brachyspira innocens]
MCISYIDNIICGDCLDLYKNIPSNSIDCIFADPPFNLSKKYNLYNDNLLDSSYLEWSKFWLEESIRVLKSDGFIFIHNIPKWLTYYSKFLNEIAYFQHWISWDAMTSPMGKTLQPAHYGILFYSKTYDKTKFREIRCPHKRDRNGKLIKDYGGKKSSLHPFGPLCSDVWTDIHRIKHRKYRDEHPCQLPVHLLERIILMSTDENDIILDPFVGTGTTSIAAKRLGRRFIGFDKDPKYCEIALNKINKETKKSKIGDSYISIYLNDVITIRNNDWDNLKNYFCIPDDIKLIDNYKIKIMDQKLIL